MNDYNYTIHATWRVEPTTPAVLGEKFLRALDLIAEAAPEIGDWTILERPFYGDLVPIDEARKIMPKLLENNVTTVDEQPDADFGYCLIALNRPDFSPKSVGLTASVGGRFGDRITFKVGSVRVPSDPALVTYPLFRTALLTIIALWPPIWANAYAYRWGYAETSSAPGIPPHPSSRYLIPWLSYLSAPLAVELELPPEILNERTPDGGLLMIAAEERLDPTNAEHMARSRAIAEIMIARAGDPGRNSPPVGKFIWPTPLNR
jgi:hypothetical protein